MGWQNNLDYSYRTATRARRGRKITDLDELLKCLGQTSATGFTDCGESLATWYCLVIVVFDIQTLWVVVKRWQSW